MYYATKSRLTQVLVWFIWAIACLVFLAMPGQAIGSERAEVSLPVLVGVVAHKMDLFFPGCPGGAGASGSGGDIVPGGESIVVRYGWRVWPDWH
jgi:hypothetical protein